MSVWDIADNSFLATNGIMQDFDEGAATASNLERGANHLGGDLLLNYNPSSDLASDSMEASGDILSFLIGTNHSENARVVGLAVFAAKMEGRTLHVAGFSQGAASTAAGVRLAAAATLGGLSNIDVTLKAGPINNQLARSAFMRAGIDVQGRAHLSGRNSDAVYTILGFNSINPVSWARSIVMAPCLAIDSCSPHVDR